MEQILSLIEQIFATMEQLLPSMEQLRSKTEVSGDVPQLRKERFSVLDVMCDLRCNKPLVQVREKGRKRSPPN